MDTLFARTKGGKMIHRTECRHAKNGVTAFGQVDHLAAFGPGESCVHHSASSIKETSPD